MEEKPEENYNYQNAFKGLKIRKYFWFLFAFYLIIFLFLWEHSFDEFSFLYMLGIGCFFSFFLAWASSIFIILFNSKDE